MRHTENIETRNRLFGIPKKATLEELLNALNLCEDDRRLMRLRYLEYKDWRYIADEIGFSESATKKRHAKILGKIGKIL